MKLYRTSNQKRRKSLTFVLNSGQQTALLDQLEKQSWVDEVFNRMLPIPEDYPSRFGPPGFSKNVLYSSERKETTFFEFSYNLLQAPSLFGRAVSGVCFEIHFQGTKKPVDVSDTKDRDGILNRKSYVAAHKWLQSLTEIPESVRYPSVREPSGLGVNVAIFECSTIAATNAAVEELILTPHASGVVDIESLTQGRLSSVQPL